MDAAQHKAEVFELRWEGKSGIKYRVLWSEDFFSWTELQESRRTGKGQDETITDTNANSVKKFYRIEVVE